MKENIIKQSKDETPVLKELDIQGDTYVTTFTRKYENRQKWVKPNFKQVISYIPGTIRQVLVKEGDSVKAEDKLLVLEAMKMMNTIYSPMAGKIKSVFVKEGDCQPKGTLMIEFE
jgi:biotin carboxyl carrier protein